VSVRRNILTRVIITTLLINLKMIKFFKKVNISLLQKIFLVCEKCVFG